MKRLTFLFILSGVLLSVNNINAQNCKYTYEKEDAFTGELTKGTRLTVYIDAFLGIESWYLFFDKKGDNFTTTMSVTLGGEHNEALEVNDSLMFKLENNKIVTLFAKEKASPISQIRNSGDSQFVVSNYTAVYDITHEQLELIASSPVTVVRMNIQSKVHEKKSKKKVGKRFLEKAHCILQ